MVGGAVVRTSASPQELAERVAATLIGRLRSIQDEGRVPSVVLTGGTIAGTLHATLAASPDSSLVDWSRVDLWWGDERYVPAADPERNAGQARSVWLDHAGVDPSRVHEAPASDSGYADVQAAAAAYAEELRADGTGVFDVVMLGVGPDGHVASLFPGYPQLEIGGPDAVAVTDSPKPPPERITLTFAALSRAQEVWFLAAGKSKATAVAAALSGADRHDIPATGVRGLARTCWYLDKEAASLLPH